MTVLFVLAAFSLVLASGFLFAFIWSVKSGQYDDDHTPGIRILLDEVPGKKQQSIDEPTKESRFLKNNPLTAD